MTISVYIEILQSDDGQVTLEYLRRLETTGGAIVYEPTGNLKRMDKAKLTLQLRTPQFEGGVFSGLDYTYAPVPEEVYSGGRFLAGEVGDGTIHITKPLPST